MNLVDSSGWLEYFGHTRYARNFVKAIESPKKLLVPVVCIYEVFKVVLREHGEEDALKAIAQMKLGQVVDIDLEIALAAAQLSVDFKIPMADGLILATAQSYDALLLTQDSDFKGLDGVKYFAKK
jgi:toxin FitB